MKNDPGKTPHYGLFDNAKNHFPIVIIMLRDVMELIAKGILLRPSKFEGHCPMIRHGCRMALMVALNWSVECVKEES